MRGPLWPSFIRVAWTIAPLGDSSRLHLMEPRTPGDGSRFTWCGFIPHPAVAAGKTRYKQARTGHSGSSASPTPTYHSSSGRASLVAIQTSQKFSCFRTKRPWTPSKRGQATFDLTLVTAGMLPCPAVTCNKVVPLWDSTFKSSRKIG